MWNAAHRTAELSHHCTCLDLFGVQEMNRRQQQHVRDLEAFEAALDLVFVESWEAKEAEERARSEAFGISWVVTRGLVGHRP